MRCGRARIVGALGALLALAVPACSDDGGDGPAPDGGADDAGPWTTGELTCAHDVISDYATREYTFADPFDRGDLGRFWHTDSSGAWTLEGESRLVVTGAGDGPGPLAMVADGHQGTEIVGWVDVSRGGWAGGPAVVCRADGPPMGAGYGIRILGDRIELFEQAGPALADAAETVPLTPALDVGADVRVVLGCTASTVTAFVFALEGGQVTGDALACASWRHGDEARVGAFALTQEEGTSAFDNVRLLLDP